jgi:hypothetical protein
MEADILAVVPSVVDGLQRNHHDRTGQDGREAMHPWPSHHCLFRITVYDVLDYLASGMTEGEILRDFPDLAKEDIRACLAFAR